MGSKPKSGGSQSTYSYGGNPNMTQAAAQQQYQTDLANWRAPTTTGTTASGPVSTTGLTGGWGTSDNGPALPAAGVLPTAPVANRNSLAAVMAPSMPYYGNQSGHGSFSQNYPYFGNQMFLGGYGR